MIADIEINELRKKLSQAEAAARINAETIEAQRFEVDLLERVLAMTTDNLESVKTARDEYAELEHSAILLCDQRMRENGALVLEIEDRDKKIAEQQREIERLRSFLSEPGKHRDGCRADAGYDCMCGLDEVLR